MFREKVICGEKIVVHVATVWCVVRQVMVVVQLNMYKSGITLLSAGLLSRHPGALSCLHPVVLPAFPPSKVA